MSSPVTIRGVHYKSHSEAGKALGVNGSAIYSAIQRGPLDNVGLGLNSGTMFPGKLNGVEYPSISAAERAAGMAKSNLLRRIKAAPGREVRGKFGKVTW